MSQEDAPPSDDAARAAIEDAVDIHDRRTADVAVWIGAEPTFTDRRSEAPEWLSDALGADKEDRARRMTVRLRERTPGAAVLRPVGRQYSGEALPRFCYGVYARRDGAPVWTGPPDLLTDGEAEKADRRALERLRKSICRELRSAGWFAAPCDVADEGGARIVARPDGTEVDRDPVADPRLARDSVHGCRIEGAGLVDALAADGTHLLAVHEGAGGEANNRFWIELPAFARVSDFTTLLAAIAAACGGTAVPSLGLRGFPPPVDETVAFTTLTPDPAVLEINLAPQPTLGAFHAIATEVFGLAAEMGLSPYRLQYNGEVSDSGGGGHLTFGGPSFERSPFFTTPALLPRLIRYVTRHPALSYWFATRYVGGSSQSPRVDEGARGAFLELAVALEQLERIDAPTPQTLWSTLRHFLADASGNPHRAELNVEKLDNPFLPGRGRLGVVELRALSMAPSLHAAVARALLFRSIVVLSMRHDLAPELVDWGDLLHDRFALPFYLRRDLGEVFADLTEAGLGLGDTVETLLLSREGGVMQSVELEGARLCVEQAVEFWPLVGDVASQEGGGSRTVDASTARLEIRLEATDPSSDVDAIAVSVNGTRVPLRREVGPDGPVRVFGVRHRSFVPWTGIHPTLPAEPLLTLTLVPPSGPACRTVLHPWHPAGSAYDGLPRHLAQATRRRRERAVTSHVDPAELPPVRDPHPRALTSYCLDLRRLPPAQRP